MRNPGSLSDPCDELCNSRDFWRGIVDGDGSVGLYTSKAAVRVIKTGRSKGKLRSWKERTDGLLQLVGHYPLLDKFSKYVKINFPYITASVRKSCNIYRVTIGGVYSLHIAQHLYENACVSMIRKREIYEDIKKFYYLQNYGVKCTQQALKDLSGRIKVEKMNIPASFEDPGAMTQEQNQELINAILNKYENN